MRKSPWRVQRSRKVHRIAAVIVFSLLCFGVYLGSQIVHASVPCPCHVFDAGDTPSSPGVFNDSSPTELGMRFKPKADGYITGVRFYKDPSMTDAHIGNLWSSTGSLLASGSFTSETGSGWQEVTFASPVAVTAGAYYTVSFYTPTGKYVASTNYFSAAKDNYPLIAPSSATVATDGLIGNGVFASGGDVYPNSTFNANNYWVDVTFRQHVNSTPPQVVSTTPAAGATNVFTSSTISAVLGQNVDASSVSGSTVSLLDANSQPVAKSVSYDDPTKTISINPSTPLNDTATYTVIVHGGAGGVTNLDGTPLAADYQWSFETGTNQCPCSVWDNTAPSNSPKSQTDAGSGGETYGVKIHADENGYIQAVRFYKPLISTAANHIVKVWATNGTLLASGTSTHETAFGWQEVPLTSSVAITQGTNYVISYYATDNTYEFTTGGLAAQAGSGPFHANASGTVLLTGADGFPNATPNPTLNYWIDGVFTTSNTYTAPFTIAVSQPLDGAYGVQPDQPLTFKMTNAVDPTTVAGSVTVKDANNNSIAGTLSYDDAEHTLSFKPTTTLTAGASYTVTIGSSLKNIYGTNATPSTVTFTTGTVLSGNMNQGPGGPVLVLTSAVNPYDTYLAEMLRAEGIDYFTVKDISQISTATLNQYRLVLLGKSALTGSQVTTLTSWVQAGGNLITMQPDKQLASLLGLTDQNQTLSEGYLKVDTTQAPGTGITSQTMQYHMSADEYDTVSGTRAVATLYSDAGTATTHPAVTERNVGSGHAAAFVYDLPKSIALTHQGNPAWAGQDRDGNAPIRPNDLFFGGGSTDWLNTSKAFIPQADEQQRLLTNMILTLDAPNTPLPRFWILPHGQKSALVMTEDDHGSTASTFTRFDAILNNSPTNCSVSDWQCERGGSLIYTSAGLTSAQADAVQAIGFSVGAHVQTGCNNFASQSALNTAYVTQIAAFQAKYTNLPAQRFDRTHCFVYSDWDSVPKVDVANGLRINFNYEWYPPAWTGSNTGYLTGSGMTMRFTDASGNLIDDYQGVSDLDYETDPTSATMNADLANALNSNEFYGVFGTHFDEQFNNYYQQLIDAAKANNVPMISADQLLTWKDALGSSSFGSITSTDSKLDFTVQVAQGGEGMQAMVPASAGNGALASLYHNGTAVSYTTGVVKGVSYAKFDAAPGTYEATYGNSPGGNSGGSTGNGSTQSGGTATATHKTQIVPASAASGETSTTVPSDTSNILLAPHITAPVRSTNQPSNPAAASHTRIWEIVGFSSGGLLVLIIILTYIALSHRRKANLAPPTTIYPSQ